MPGAFVRHPSHPEWGLGQVQSVTGARVTVNFEGAGKVLILIDRVSLVAADPEGPPVIAEPQPAPGPRVY